MPTEWARTEDRDMYFPPAGQGKDALVTDLREIALIKIPSVIEFVLGEWKPDLSLGFPWEQIWAQKNPSPPQTQALLRKAILAIRINGAPLVATVNNLYALTVSATRAAKYGFLVTLVNGQQVSFP